MASFALVSEISSFSQYEDLKRQGKRFVLFFWANWHEPSKVGGSMHTIIASLAEKYPAVSFFRVEAEAVSELSEALQITVVPSFYGSAGSNVFPKVEGANPPEISKLTKLVNEAPIVAPPNPISKPSATTSSSSETTAAALDPTSKPTLSPQLRDRLNILINSSPVMLFMKGSPAAPRCGFSRQIVEILQTNDVPFASFDILGDEDVRGGLKLLSDWPTYPQLYAAGELIGGLDIVKEMVASGSPLREQLRIEEISSVPAALSLDERLKALINTAPVMLFMKGSPDIPRCGFSRSICALLREHSISFESFDILQDEEVRAGLKVLSDWPTYPQLYVKGTLVGGLDIVKEMAATGPLNEQLEL